MSLKRSNPALRTFRYSQLYRHGACGQALIDEWLRILPRYIDPTNIRIAGFLSGSDLAAGTILLARDQGGGSLRTLFLECRMLTSEMTAPCLVNFRLKEYGALAVDFGWICYLARQVRGHDEISIYASPAPASDMSSFAPTFVLVSSCDGLGHEVAICVKRTWENRCQV